MSIFEIILGVLLVVCGLVIGFLVLAQEPSNGGAGAIAGGADAYSAMQSRSTDAKIAQVTKYAGIAFFVVAILVNVVDLLAK